MGINDIPKTCWWYQHTMSSGYHVILLDTHDKYWITIKLSSSYPQRRRMMAECRIIINCQKLLLHHHHLHQTTIANKIPASPNSKAVLTEASLGFSETAVASSLSHLRDQFTIIFEPWSICHDPDCHATSAEQINSVFISILESWSWLSLRWKGILPVCILPIPGWTIGMIRPVFGWRTFRFVDELWT